jgi:hypothetical protein
MKRPVGRRWKVPGLNPRKYGRTATRKPERIKM